MKLMTLGDLRAATAHLPDDTPLVGRTSGNSFGLGNDVAVIEVRPLKTDPRYLVGPNKAEFPFGNLDPAIKVVSFT